MMNHLFRLRTLEEYLTRHLSHNLTTGNSFPPKIGFDDQKTRNGPPVVAIGNIYSAERLRTIVTQRLSQRSAIISLLECRPINDVDIIRSAILQQQQEQSCSSYYSY